MILLTGGSGLLGQELQKYINCYNPTHEAMDITKRQNVASDFDMIVHCAAYTDIVKAEEDRESCYAVNVRGTKHMAQLGLPIVYISTEYIFGGGRGNYKTSDPPDPINYYALTKLLGEDMCSYAPASLIIRCVFKPIPFEHTKACTDQWTSGDYVDKIAVIIAGIINGWSKKGHHVLHVGTGRKSIYELARQTRPDVEPCLRSDIKSVKLPMDTSLELNWRGNW